jgi:hypothetical protein
MADECGSPEVRRAVETRRTESVRARVGLACLDESIDGVGAMPECLVRQESPGKQSVVSGPKA